MSEFIKFYCYRNQVERVQGKCVSLETENACIKEQLGSMIGSVEVLTTERDDLQDVKEKNEAEMKKKLEVLCMDTCIFTLNLEILEYTR